MWTTNEGTTVQVFCVDGVELGLVASKSEPRFPGYPWQVSAAVDGDGVMWVLGYVAVERDAKAMVEARFATP